MFYLSVLSVCPSLSPPPPSLSLTQKRNVIALHFLQLVFSSFNGCVNSLHFNILHFFCMRFAIHREMNIASRIWKKYFDRTRRSIRASIHESDGWLYLYVRHLENTKSQTSKRNETSNYDLDLGICCVMIPFRLQMSGSFRFRLWWQT